MMCDIVETTLKQSVANGLADQARHLKWVSVSGRRDCPLLPNSKHKFGSLHSRSIFEPTCLGAGFSMECGTGGVLGATAIEACPALVFARSDHQTNGQDIYYRLWRARGLCQ
eukprot:92808-Pelagomonas_calceolata.AAC.2